MTRGKIIFIDTDGKMYRTTEFNGDMYPEGKADEVLERFEDGYFNCYKNFERFVERFNKRNYGYEEELVHRCDNEPAYQCDELELVLNIQKNFTDYLYVINNCEKSCVIVDEHNNTTLLTHNSLAVIYFKEVEEIYHRAVNENSNQNFWKLSKKEFCDILEKLRESRDLVDKVNALFWDSRENIGNDFCNVASLQISHESTVVRLLKLIMDDQADWIEYFIYELDYGRKYEPGMILDEKSNDIDISSSGKLYDFISDTCKTGRKEM
jgi:hypothetical protein